MSSPLKRLTFDSAANATDTNQFRLKASVRYHQSTSKSAINFFGLQYFSLLSALDATFHRRTRLLIRTQSIQHQDLAPSISDPCLGVGTRTFEALFGVDCNTFTSVVVPTLWLHFSTF